MSFQDPRYAPPAQLSQPSAGPPSAAPWGPPAAAGTPGAHSWQSGAGQGPNLHLYPYLADMGGPLRPSRGSWRGRIITAVAVVLVGLGTLAAFGVNAYARNQVCSALTVSEPAPSADNENAAAKTATTNREMDEMAAQLRTFGRMLVIDRSLKAATEAIATDLEQAARLQRAVTDGTGDKMSMVSEANALIGSMNANVRQAQEACGLPPTGLPPRS